jgi:hypothetical protein
MHIGILIAFEQDPLPMGSVLLMFDWLDEIGKIRVEFLLSEERGNAPCN